MTSKTGSQSQTTQQLNVLFHGLWAFRVEDNGLRAFTIPNHHHVMKGGAWDPQESLDTKQYELKEVDAGPAKLFNTQQNLVVQKGAPPNGANLCSIVLPFPREIHSKRRFAGGSNPVFESNTLQIQTPAEVSMLQVLTYDCRDLSKVYLEPLKWQPVIENGVANLHLFSQPDGSMALPADHFKVAFKDLAQSFGLDIKPIRTSSVDPDDPSGIRGVNVQDQLGLDERKPHGGGMDHETEAVDGAPVLDIHGVSGSNCENLVMQ